MPDKTDWVAWRTCKNYAWKCDRKECLNLKASAKQFRMECYKGERGDSENLQQVQSMGQTRQA